MFDRKPKPWRMRIVLGLVILGLALILAGGIFLSRVATKVLTVQAVAEASARPSDPLVPGYRGDPKTALGLVHETVQLRTQLGDTPAWYVPARGANGLGAIYVHGIRGAREDGYRFLSVLHDVGVPTLMISYRNDPVAPRSPEGWYGFGLIEWPDLEVAVEEMRARGFDRIVLLGDGMGAAIAGQFLARSSEAPEVTALVLDSPALDFTAVLRGMAGRLGLPGASVLAPVAGTLLALTGPVDLRQAQVVRTIAGFRGPLFLAHGTEDRQVPASISGAVLAQRQGATTVFRTGAEYLGSFAADPDGYRRALADFLRAAAG